MTDRELKWRFRRIVLIMLASIIGMVGGEKGNLLFKHVLDEGEKIAGEIDLKLKEVENG